MTGKYEIGTPLERTTEDCLVCAIKIANEKMNAGQKTYIRDTETNRIIYGDYFPITKGD